MSWSQGRDDTAAEAALKDLATLLEGPAKTIDLHGRSGAGVRDARSHPARARGRSAEARDAFDAALKVDSDETSPRSSGRGGDVLFDEGRNTEAISRFDTAKQVDGNSVQAIAGAAKTEIALERLADAKKQMVEAVKRFPKSSLALQWLAMSESALGDKKSAEKDFLGAMDLVDPKDPDAIEPYAAYVNFLATQGRADEAQSKLQEAVKKLPDSVGLERTLGDVAVVQAHYDEALTRYNAALTMDARDVSSRFRLGQVLRKTGKFDEASKVFDDVYAADKNYPNLALERGLLFQKSGDVQKALDQFKAALDKSPNDPDLKLRVGAAYVMIGQGEKAEPLLREVGKDRPNSAEADHYWGRSLMLQGPIHYQEAMRHLQIAASRESNRAEYHLYVGWLANSEIPPDLGLAAKEVGKSLALDQTLADAVVAAGGDGVPDQPQPERGQRSPARPATQADPLRGARDAGAGLRAEEHARRGGGRVAPRARARRGQRARSPRARVLELQVRTEAQRSRPVCRSGDAPQGRGRSRRVVATATDVAGEGRAHRRAVDAEDRRPGVVLYALPGVRADERSERPRPTRRAQGLPRRLREVVRGGSSSLCRSAPQRAIERECGAGVGVDIERLAARVERDVRFGGHAGDDVGGSDVAPRVAELLSPRAERAFDECAE